MEKKRKVVNIILWSLAVVVIIAMIFAVLVEKSIVNKKETALCCVLDSMKTGEVFVVSSDKHQYLIDRLDHRDGRNLAPKILFADRNYFLTVKDSLYLLSNPFKPVADMYSLEVIKKQFADSTVLLFITKKEGVLEKTKY